MSYLIDSDILSDFLAGESEVVQRLDRLAAEGVLISIITYMETYEGTFREPDPVGSQRHHGELLIGIPVLPVTIEIAQLCAELRYRMSEEGRRVRSRALDLIIAATAIHHGYTLVTRNVADYRDIPNLNLA